MAFPRPLKELQDEISERIADDDTLIGLHVISQDKGDIDTQVEEAVAAPSRGVFVVIEVLTAKTRTRSTGGYAMDLTVGLTIHEQVTINRVGENFMAWDYVLMGLITLFGPKGNANQDLEINSEGFDTLQDVGGLVKIQLVGKAIVGFVRT